MTDNLDSVEQSLVERAKKPLPDFAKLSHDRPLDKLPNRIQQWVKLVANGASMHDACRTVTGRDKVTGLVSRWSARYKHLVAIETQKVLDSRIMDRREVLERMSVLGRQGDDLKVALGATTKLGEWQGNGASKGEIPGDAKLVKILGQLLGLSKPVEDVIDAEVIEDEQ